MVTNPELTADLAEAAPLYAQVKSVIPAIEWPVHAPYVVAINDLKKRRNAVVLAHNDQTPEIYHCVADILRTRVNGEQIAPARFLGCRSDIRVWNRNSAIKP